MVMRYLAVLAVLVATLQQPVLAKAQEVAQLEARVKALEEKLNKMKEIQDITARRVGLGALVPYESIGFDDGHVVGKKDAPIVIMEFTDLECPYCREFYKTIFPKIKSKLVDSGKVVFVSRDFPLINSHKQAGYAAVALRCARQQGQYDKPKSYLFDNTGKLVPESLKKEFVSYGMDEKKLDACMNNQNIHQEVKDAYQLGMDLGLASTPSFLIGKNKGEKLTDYKVVTGAGTLEQFEEIIAEIQK